MDGTVIQPITDVGSTHQSKPLVNAVTDPEPTGVLHLRAAAHCSVILMCTARRLDLFCKTKQQHRVEREEKLTCPIF